MKFRHILFSVFITLFAFLMHPAFSHNVYSSANGLRIWKIGDRNVPASFLFEKNDSAFLQNEQNEVIKVAMNSLLPEDKSFVEEREKRIQKLNATIHAIPVEDPNSFTTGDFQRLGVVLAVMILLLIFTRILITKHRFRYSTLILITGILGIFYGFREKQLRRTTSTTRPSFVDSAFAPFKPNVNTRWDNTYFYVESKGIPTTHNMMTGITGWQQQVPIPQCYIGTNAWSIPLNPVIAPNPVPVNPAHFSRGAIAIAVNGIAIFNPYTNTGVDAYLDGQLDNWGGHCGRADDYHYHTAPMHLYGTTDKKLPIAFALDGFAVYGAYEPDGTAMSALDANHGHYGTNGVYHYHGSAAAPYMIANMVGVITEDTTHQIIPQAQASPVRPGQNPLKGAVITSCVPNGSNGYILSYTLNAQVYQVSYSWTTNGVYTFNFINPGGTTTSTYNGFKPCSLPTGIQSLYDTESRFSLFPNPAHNEIRIYPGKELSPEEIKNITILSSTGQVAHSVNGYDAVVKTDKLTPGLYFVILKTTGNTLIKKLVIE